MTFTLHHGDCIEVMRGMADGSVDSIVTDPPYELGFMGKSWDSTGIAYSVEMWAEALRVLKPGGHLLAFSGSRTYHRMAVAIEDAGFEIRDQIMWVYGSGFPKSMAIDKQLDKQLGVEREVVGRNPNSRENSTKDNTLFESGTVGKTDYITKPFSEKAKKWEGWGTALKPAHEPIVLARKPFAGTVANNVLQHGTGALNIDGSRVEMGDEYDPTKVHRHVLPSNATIKGTFGAASLIGKEFPEYNVAGRWPANVIHDGSDEVVDGFPDNGSAARFFYCAKANKRDRNEGLDENTNNHPTVKPVDLMRYLVKLITPPGGVVLDPFMGSGSTGKGAVIEGFNFVGIEQDADYLDIARARIQWALKREVQLTINGGAK
jgi:site-specific DNA-methyltransferase (adenine-specific)